MEESKKKYKFRKVKGRDIFKLARFFKKIDKEEINEFLKDSKNSDLLFKGKNGEENKNNLSVLGVVALKLINIILDNMDKLENDFFELITDFSELSADEIENLDLEEFENLVVDFFAMPQISDFLKRMLQRLGLQAKAPQTTEE